MKITRFETFLANAGLRNYLLIRLTTDTRLTGVVHERKIEHGGTMAAIGGLRVPLDRLGTVLRNTPAFLEDQSKRELRLDVPLVGVGLFYAHGYFLQRLDRDGWQRE